MEFTNEIFFNKNLVRNETVLITYSGKLFREHSGEVFIVYGYDENWKYTEENKMVETENGFEVSINLKDFNTFNFCFRNNYNIWDNNFGFNYIAPIEEIKESSENQNIQIENSTEEIINENNDKNIVNEEDDEPVNFEEFEKLFQELLDSITKFEKEDSTIQPNLENGFGLQSVDEINEINLKSCDDLFEDIFKDIDSPGTSEIETLLSDFSEKQEKEKQISDAKELDKLMDDILESVTEENSNESLKVSDIDDSIWENGWDEKDKNESDFEISDVPVPLEEPEDFLDKFIDVSCNFFQNVWNGCKKLGSLIKQKAKSLLSEEK